MVYDGNWYHQNLKISFHCAFSVRFSAFIQANLIKKDCCFCPHESYDRLTVEFETKLSNPIKGKKTVIMCYGIIYGSSWVTAKGKILFRRKLFRIISLQCNLRMKLEYLVSWMPRVWRVYWIVVTFLLILFVQIWQELCEILMVELCCLRGWIRVVKGLRQIRRIQQISLGKLSLHICLVVYEKIQDNRLFRRISKLGFSQVVGLLAEAERC